MNHDHHHGQAHHLPSDPERVKDPVCGMTVSPETTRWKHEHGGRGYFFCSERCLTRFRSEPEKYHAEAGKVMEPPHHAAPQQPASSPGLYTCPMHPEVRSTGPGSCPSCGMALES